MKTATIGIKVDASEAQKYIDRHVKPLIEAMVRDRDEILDTLIEARAAIYNAVEEYGDQAEVLDEINAVLGKYRGFVP